MVVHRCRKHDYKALRLPPSIWRSLGRIEEAERTHPGTPLAETVKSVDLGLSKRPGVHLVEALREAVPRHKLDALVRRHAEGEADPKRPGVPDLFVYKQHKNGRAYAPRFVEVKRQDEALGSHQEEEIRVMRDLDLKGGVLRLIEHPGGTKREKAHPMDQPSRERGAR